MTNNVEEIKARLNIVDIVGEYVRLTKAGTNWKGLCPFHHEKSPSFMVNEEKQIFHCFGCAKGGDMFTFVEEMESLGFREALKILAEKAGVQLEEYKGQDESSKQRKRVIAALELATKFYETQLWKGAGKERIINYLHERGLTDESIKEYRLGYAPSGWRNVLNFLTQRGFALDEIVKTGLLVERQPVTTDLQQSAVVSNKSSAVSHYDRFRDRIMFPIQDAMGAVVGYSARVAPGGDESQAKYINTPETGAYQKSKILYGIFNAKQEIKKRDGVLLVEGNMDVIASHQAGIKNVVAVSGTALTQEQISIIKRYTGNLNMLFDMDSAGQAAAARSVDLCFQNDMKVRIVELPEGKDAAEAVQKNPDILTGAVENAIDAAEYFFKGATKKYDAHSAQGKQRIARETLSHIAFMSNSIERSHWVKKIAHDLDVEENVIGDVLRALTDDLGRTNRVKKEGMLSDTESFERRSDVIRDSMLGIIMSEPEIWKGTVEREKDKEWAKRDPIIRTVFDEGGKTGFSFESMIGNIDDDPLKGRLRQMRFAAKYKFSGDDIGEYTKEELGILVDENIARYEGELQKEKLHSIIRDIKCAEREGDKEALTKLMGELTELSHRLHDN